MNRDEHFFIRQQFRLKIYESDGQAFEDFFIAVMKAHNPNFEGVKPQGKKGDKKNDGFDKTSGKYYQVFAPEDIRKSISSAIRKLEEDFKGLYMHWNHLYPIKQFFFVLNDKYKDAYPDLHTKLSEIKSLYPHVECGFFSVSRLEKVFFELPEHEIFQLVGLPPNVTNLNNIDFGAMNKVVHYLLNKEFSYSQEQVPENADFNKKIQFNQLSKHSASLLEQGYYQNHVIREYFEYDGKFARDELRTRFSNLYNEGLQKFGPSKEESDLIFHYILNSSRPSKTKPVSDAVLVLMAYYFEYCDIFEEPSKESLF